MAEALASELLDRQSSRCGKCGLDLQHGEGRVIKLVPDHYLMPEHDPIELLSTALNAVYLCRECVRAELPYEPMIEVVFIGEGRKRERLLAKPLGQREYEILATPLITPGVSIGDIVTVTLVGRDFTFKEIVQESGAVSVNLRVKNPKEFEFLLIELKTLDCFVSTIEHGWCGISVPIDADSKQVMKILHTGEEFGFWQWGILNDPSAKLR
jgi:hypothetical protein